MFVEQNKLDIEPQVINRFYLTLLSQQTEEIVGARMLLDHAVGRFELVLVTNGFPEVQHPRILKSAFGDYFKHIIISEEIGHSKPAREFFDYAFEKMGSPKKEQVMIIGDSLSSDIKGGAQYGIRTCWFNLQGITNQSGIQPDYTVTSLVEISQMLQP
jgi:2-haloacid dehalogenase